MTSAETTMSARIPHSPARDAAITADAGIVAVLTAFRHNLPADRVSLHDLIRALGDRSFGSILLALAIPTIMPVPLGISVLCDLPVFLFSARRALGDEGGLLPAWLLQRSVTHSTAARLLDSVLPRIAILERWLKPRLPHITTPGATRRLALAAFGLSLICIVPMPLTGWLPGFALVLMALGLVERDGTAVLTALGLGGVALIFALIVAFSLGYAGHLMLAP